MLFFSDVHHIASDIVAISNLLYIDSDAKTFLSFMAICRHKIIYDNLLMFSCCVKCLHVPYIICSSCTLLATMPKTKSQVCG